MRWMRSNKEVAVAAMLLCLCTGCKRQQPQVAVSTSEPAPAAPASVAAPVQAPVTTTSAEGVTSTSTLGDPKAVEWALKQDEIKNDPDGQWATVATVSSTYGDAKDKQSWAAWQMTGAPNADHYGDSGDAWAPRTQDAGIEWAELTFAKAVMPTGVRIRENCGSGSVVKVELVDEVGLPHALWTGTDPTRGLNYLQLTFPKTTYKVSKVKVSMATNLIPGWNEIDAVQLLSSDK